MSMDMKPRSTSFTIKVGSTTTLELVIKNADGTARDLTNTTIFYRKMEGMETRWNTSSKRKHNI